MALKKMALTKAESEKEYGDCAPCTASDAEDGPKYPWGLSLCLDDVILGKLGMGLMPVGTEVYVMAKATITGTSSRERVKGEKREDMDVQITEMDVTISASDRSAKAASKLYPDTDGDSA